MGVSFTGFQGIYYLWAVGMILHTGGIFTGIPEDGTIRGYYGNPCASKASQFLSHGIKVGFNRLAFESRQADSSGDYCFFFKLITQAIQLVITDRTGDEHSQDSHTDDYQQYEPDGNTPLNTTEQCYPSNL